MNFNNKVRVTKENQRMLEYLLGDKVFLNDIIYLDNEDFNMIKTEKNYTDYIGIINQEFPKYLTIWDDVNYLNVDANLCCFSDSEVYELEEALDAILMPNYGECN